MLGSYYNKFPFCIKFIQTETHSFNSYIYIYSIKIIKLSRRWSAPQVANAIYPNKWFAQESRGVQDRQTQPSDYLIHSKP